MFSFGKRKIINTVLKKLISIANKDKENTDNKKNENFHNNI